MGLGAVQRAAVLLAACNKQLLEATRRLLMGGGCRPHPKATTVTCVLCKVNKSTGKNHHQRAAASAASGELWRRSILMGEKCDPINFSGAIFYDSHGRRLSEAPPRSPKHALPSAKKETGFSPFLPPPPAASSPKWIARY